MPSADSRIQVLKGVPLNIVLPGNQLAQDKRALFPSPDTTVTVSIAAMPNYPVKTEGPSHAFSVTVPNPHCSESEGHATVFERQLVHSQFSPNTQPRTPDSTFPETYKDGGQEVNKNSPSMHQESIVLCFFPVSIFFTQIFTSYPALIISFLQLLPGSVLLVMLFEHSQKRR